LKILDDDESTGSMRIALSTADVVSVAVEDIKLEDLQLLSVEDEDEDRELTGLSLLSSDIDIPRTST
jgi:hypothetical protein